jgi:uncharacterized protein (DUF1778 family)
VNCGSSAGIADSAMVSECRGLTAIVSLPMHGKIPYICAMQEDPMPRPRRKQPVDRELKRERIELRVTVSAKELIQRAMAVSGLTAGDLAYEGARRVLDEHERMVLTGRDRDAFLDAVANPTAPAKKLVAALKRHRQLLE